MKKVDAPALSVMVADPLPSPVKGDRQGRAMTRPTSDW